MTAPEDRPGPDEWPGPDERAPHGWPGLEDEEAAAWAALAGVLTALPAALGTQVHRDAGMGLVDLHVLSWLAATPDRAAKMSVVAEMATVSPSHVSRVAARLERRGWLRRVPDPDDGRGTIAELTEAGLAAFVAGAPGHAEDVRRLVFGRLTSRQIAQLEQICRRILDAVRPDHCVRVPTGH